MRLYFCNQWIVTFNIKVELTWLALQSSDVQRHAMMLDPGVSEMSCGSQRLLGSSGALMGPSRMDSEKYSRMMLVSSFIRVGWFVVIFLKASNHL